MDDKGPVLQGTSSEASSSAPVAGQRIAGFWKRLLAFAIDAIIVSIPCAVVGSSSFDFFADSPARTMLIGFVLTLPYFAVMGSALCGGRTFGHRIMHVRVVDREGRPPSWEDSTIRYSILLVPMLFNSDILLNSTSTLGIVIGSLVGAVNFLIGYLYLFNRGTRQSLHDLAVRTFVVDDHGRGRVDAGPMWSGHWKIVVGIAVAAAIVPAVAVPVLKQRGPFAEAFSINDAIQQSGEVRQSGVETATRWANGTRTNHIDVTVVYKEDPYDSEGAAVDIAAIVLRADPKAMQQDYISVVSSSGFKLGFASLWKRKTTSHTPEEWKDLIRRYGSNP